MIHTFFFHSVFQVIANTLLLLSANLIGYYYQFMSSKSQKRTFEQIRSTVESRVKLECEKEHQEQLLLSVIPAYIAAEVCTRLNVSSVVCMFSTADLEIKNVPNPLRRYHLSAICPEDI